MANKVESPLSPKIDPGHFFSLSLAILALLLITDTALAQGIPRTEGKITYSGAASTGSPKTPKKHPEPNPSDNPGSLASDIDVLVHGVMENQGIPGLALSVTHNGEVVLSRGYGKCDLENNVSALPISEFRTASIAKPMTAVAVLKLVEEGKLDLDAPVQQYCAAFPEKTSPKGKPWVVTTRELLSHRAGIRWYRDDVETANANHYDNLDEAVKHFAGDPLLFEPGTQSRYSSYGYVVIGCVIEGAAHQSYLEFLREVVLDPAGMESTMEDDPRRIISHRAHGYDHGHNGKGPLENAPFFDPSDRVPGGGFLSTSDDLVRFASAVMEAKLLRPDTLKLMWTPASPNSEGANKQAPYGLGWGIGTLDGVRVVGHNGGQAGTSTSLKLVPERDLAVAIMTNVEGAQLDDLAEKVLRLYMAQK